MRIFPIRFAEVCTDGMRDAMQQVEYIARATARWNPDGVDTGKWYVTGTARRSIRGYVHGEPANLATFGVTDTKYGSIHVSPAASYDAIPIVPGSIIGVLTMSEQHSADLQWFEQVGTRSGLSPLGPGEPITIEALRNSEQLVWNCIWQHVRLHMRW